MLNQSSPTIIKILEKNTFVEYYSKVYRILSLPSTSFNLSRVRSLNNFSALF